VAYAFKLLLQEMQSLNIAPRLLIKEKLWDVYSSN
jgi:DNA-directed RNA polymerase subunit B